MALSSPLKPDENLEDKLKLSIQKKRSRELQLLVINYEKDLKAWIKEMDPAYPSASVARETKGNRCAQCVYVHTGLVRLETITLV